MSTRIRLVVLGVVLGGAIGLVASLAQPMYCFGGGTPGFDAVFVCSYKSLFVWDAAPIVADAVFASVGAVLGGIGGWMMVLVRRRRRIGAV